MAAAHCFHAAAQSEREDTLLARRVVAVDEHRVISGKLLQKATYNRLVIFRRALIHLEDVPVGRYLGGIDGERYQHLDVVLAGKVGERLHLLGVQRPDYQVAPCRVLVPKRLGNVGILRHVPRPYVHRYAVLLQTVAGHEHSAIVFHHALSVAIHIMQRQHHAHTYLPLPHVHILGLLRLGYGCGAGRRLRCGIGSGIRNKYGFALFQLIVGTGHLGIGLYQLFHGNPIVAGYAEDGFLLLYLVYLFPLCGLRRHGSAEERGHQQWQQVS